MHSFAELANHSTNFTLRALEKAQSKIVTALDSSAATPLVKALQVIQLQKAIMAVGMFSIFEAMIQDVTNGGDGFSEAFKALEAEEETNLKKRFAQYFRAINVLKHGRGRSYNELLVDIDDLPFRIKRPDEGFFSEGDVSEISALVEVDDNFVMECANLIRRVSAVIAKANP